MLPAFGRVLTYTSHSQFPVVPSAPLPDSTDRFAPAYGADRKLLRETPAVGTRYCQHIHAYVPENLPYRVSGLAAAPKAPLGDRLLSREFWQLPFTGEDGAGSKVKMNIRVVPAKPVHAEGLTHHQAQLVPLREAQRDLGIKYRSLTQTRDDLVEVAVAVFDTEKTYPGMVGGPDAEVEGKRTKESIWVPALVQVQEFALFRLDEP